MARTFLLDGTALAYRSHFALAARGSGLTTSDGHPTSATFGFTMTLRALLRREKVERIAVAFDGPAEQLERTAMYADYKATRQKAPDELKMQFDDVREVVAGYGIPILELEGQEADDVIATLAVRCREAGDEVFIVTSDKDFMQLVDAKLKLYDIMQRGSAEPKIVGPGEVIEKFGVPPDKIVDLLALMGDSSDNIPGVKGVGAKTAASLLEEHGSLDSVLAAAPAIKKAKLRENLIECRAAALLSRELVRIRTDLELPIAPEELGPVEPDAARLLQIFKRLEFRQFVDELLKEAAPKVEVAGEADYRIAESLETCRALVRRLENATSFVVHPVTGLTTDGAPALVGLAFSYGYGKGWYVPLRGTFLPAGHDCNAWLGCFRRLLEAPQPARFDHDIKRGIQAMRRAGIELGGLTFDSKLASYCVAPGTRRHTLADQVQHYFELHRTAKTELTGTGRKALALHEVPLDALGRWAAEGADFTYRLRDALEAELDAFAVRELLYEIELPLVPVLADMEERGVKLDVDYMAELHDKMGARLDELGQEIWQRAGEEFNIGSNQQLGRILFEKLQIHKETKTRPPRRTATGQWATDATTLERLQPHPLAERLLEWRRLTKLKSTYVDALPALVRAATGRVHTSFNQAVAATGRLSSEDPNLQNIPIRTEDGRQIRRAFIPGEPDWVMISADYSQIELRILAHLSGDENLEAGFHAGQDVHARTASIVFGVSPELVDTGMRSVAKVVNYGLIYGMGAQRVATETGMSQTEARRFIDAYFQAMPKVKGWLDRTLVEARETGEVRTIFGRRRPLPDIHARAPGIRAAAQNIAVNSPIQGSAADIIKRAMIRLHEAIKTRGLEGRMLLQVHDELVVECPESETAAMSAALREAMEGAADLGVPLEVDVGVGKNWLEAHS